jgi:hypothetical protein
MGKLRSVLLLGGLASVAACVPQRQAPPPPEPQRPVLPPPVRTAPPPPRTDWRDIPLTPGSWFYRNEGQVSFAMFGSANGEALFIVRCDRAGRQVRLSRAGSASGGAMTVRTSYSARSFPVAVQAEPLPYVSANLAATDRFLDEIAFSRGRFTVEVPGLSMLVIPAWPEPARVVEDCRS